MNNLRTNLTALILPDWPVFKFVHGANHDSWRYCKSFQAAPTIGTTANLASCWWLDLGNLLLAFRLNAIQYKTLMITGGILRRRDNDCTVNNNLLQELQRQLQPDIPIHVTRCQLQHRSYRNFFLSVGEPIHWMPNLQLRNKHRIRRNPQQQQLTNLCNEDGDDNGYNNKIIIKNDYY